MYGVTKRSNELIAYAYSNLYNLNSTGLRYFTVYGPWYRPDMAMFIFTKNILEKKPIKVFNNGIMQRDFTYIDDIINGIRSSIKKCYNCEIFNLGNSKTETIYAQGLGSFNMTSSDTYTKFVIYEGDPTSTIKFLDLNETSPTVYILLVSP